MKAAVYVGDATTLAIEDLKPNPPGPRDVVVEIGASGVCHSDLSIMRGYVPVPPGMVLGHEGAGKVVEVGAEVSRVKKGDRVVASFVPACGGVLVLPARAVGAVRARERGQHGDARHASGRQPVLLHDRARARSPAS